MDGSASSMTATMDSSSSSSKETLQPDPLTPPLDALYWTQYGTWYPIFRKHAPKSTVIDIQSVQPELLDWLDSETFVLPEGSGPSTASTSVPIASSSSSSSSSHSSVDAGDDSDEEDETLPVKLSAMDTTIRSAIEKFDGAVFPKLNWSAPQDASFMLAGNTLSCQHPEDIYLLLKSSEFIGRDLEQISHLSSSRISPQLVLKKWFPLNRSYEFRCFVRSHRLIALCQRDMTFYDHLQDAYLQNEIRGAIWDFHEEVMRAKKEWECADYIMDVYCTKDLGRVWLVDVNAWLPRSDALLWGWDELDALHLREKSCRHAAPLAHSDEGLEEGVTRIHFNPSKEEEEGGWNESDVQLRVVSDRRMQSAGGSGATYSSNMVPKDLVEFARTQSGADGQATQGMSVDQIVSRWNAQVDSE